MTVLFYNGLLLDAYQLDDPQELFREGRWTVDRMLSQLEAVGSDLNGDDKYTLSNDQYGLVGREYEFQPILFPSEVSLVSSDEEPETFSFNMLEENFLTVAEKIGSIYQSGNTFVDYNSYDAGRNAFSDGRALYYSRLLGDLRNLREVEDDYGVIPFPKHSETDRSSYFVQNPTTLFLSLVPGNDPESIGIFLEAVGAYSYDVTRDIYIRYAVIGKGIRDESSAEVVRAMIENRSFDLCQAFGFDSVLNGFWTCVTTNAQYASMAQKNQKLFNKTAGKVLGEIEKNR